MTDDHANEATALSDIFMWFSAAVGFLQHHWLTTLVFLCILVLLVVIIAIQCCCGACGACCPRRLSSPAAV